MYNVRMFRAVVSKPFNTSLWITPSRHFGINKGIKYHLLESSLASVGIFGGDDHCIASAVAQLGLPVHSHKILRRGIGEVVQYYFERNRNFVFDSFVLGNTSSAQLEHALNIHIDQLLVFHHLLGDALSIILHPREWPYTLHTMVAIVDDLCTIAAVKSTRSDWYLERSFMACLFTTTVLYMLTDTSPRAAETRLVSCKLQLCHFRIIDFS